MRKVLDEVFCVRPHAREETRRGGVHAVQPDETQAALGGDAAALPGVATGVEDICVDPREVVAVREAAIESARRGKTMTYAPVQMIAYEITGLWLGWSLTRTMCGEINRQSDGCVLSSIIVGSDTDCPGDGFRPFAQRMGFVEPFTTLQRNAFEHFAQADDGEDKEQ